MGRFKDSIYNYAVRKNENVRAEYERYVMEHTLEHYEHRGMHWKILWKLNWHYRVQKKKDPLLYWDSFHQTADLGGQKNANQQENANHQKPQESSRENEAGSRENMKQNVGGRTQSGNQQPFRRQAPYHFVLNLLKYDVISFDIFDTLLLRPFEHPTDLFCLVGKRLQYPAVFTDYTKARREAEKEARDELEKRLGIREVNIHEIYERLGAKTGISPEEGIRTEFETERDYLFANPYMEVVFRILRSQNKTIVLTSDMYFPESYMRQLAEGCGFLGYEKMYVSCDYRCNKSSGELFRRVLADYEGKRIVHVGDNPAADLEGAKKAGIDAVFYRNVNDVGKAERAVWMSNLTGSAYNGMVNAYLYNGIRQYPFFYQYGFAYGGIYIWGFCNWLAEKAKKENIDKIIFLSRDGDIYQKVYNRFYGEIPNEYIFWSRFANLKYLIEYNQDAFFDRVVKQKAYGTLDVTLQSIFTSLSIQIPEEELKQYGLYANSVVNSYNIKAIRQCILDHWDLITASYDREKELAAAEVKRLLGDAGKIAVVDVGWTASGPIGFKTFVEKYVKADCEIKCFMAGGAGSYGTGSYVLPEYMEGSVEAYLFSPEHNRRNEQIHISENVAVTNNAVFELFTQTQYPSYRGIKEDFRYEFDIPETENYQIIAQIHKGIMDFCSLYQKTFQKDPYLYRISGFDAYRPFAKLAFHKSYFEHNFRDVVNAYGLSGDNELQHIETIGMRMDKWYANNGGKK